MAEHRNIMFVLDRERSIAPDEQLDTFRDSLCHQCMNGCVNVVCVVKRFE